MATTPIPVKSATVGLPGILEVGHSWGLDGGTLEGWTGGTLGGWTATHPGSRTDLRGVRRHKGFTRDTPPLV